MIYLAIDDVLASIYERDTLSETRTGGYVSEVVAFPIKYDPGEAFNPAALRSIIEKQAHWTQADLIRLGLIGN